MTTRTTSSVLKNLAIASTVVDAIRALRRGDKRSAALLLGAATLSKRFSGLGVVASVLLRVARRFR